MQKIDHLEAWFSSQHGNQKSLTTKFTPKVCWANFDETMIQPHTNSRGVKVVGFSDADATGSEQREREPELPHITLGVTIFADGTHFVTNNSSSFYPSKFIPQEVRGANASALCTFFK
jgi:hypothetical protein